MAGAGGGRAGWGRHGAAGERAGWGGEGERHGVKGGEDGV